MQKYLFLFLVMSGQMYGMQKQKDKPVTIIVAAWAMTPETPLNEQSEVRIWQLPGGRTMSYTCRPQGVFDTQLPIKSVVEFTPSEKHNAYPLLLKYANDQFEITQSAPEEPWYKHPVATHSAAILSTILLMSALFR